MLAGTETPVAAAIAPFPELLPGLQLTNSLENRPPRRESAVGGARAKIGQTDQNADRHRPRNDARFSPESANSTNRTVGRQNGDRRRELETGEIDGAEVARHGVEQACMARITERLGVRKNLMCSRARK